MAKFNWVSVILTEFLQGGKTKNGVYLLLLALITHYFFGETLDLNQIVANSVEALPQDMPPEAVKALSKLVNTDVIKSEATRAIPILSKILGAGALIVGTIGIGHDFGKKIKGIRKLL